MCGIVGYTGWREATPLLLEGLRRLEYRGYDSAGVAIQNGKGLDVRKLAGRVAGLEEALVARPAGGTSGIAHTRWATHGAPTAVNAHPHSDCSETFALVHNGIIENADALRAGLEARGHRFRTETDTETIVHLIEDAVGPALED
ncbi:MAG: glutamine--fructose-6-phosphate aminotransferase, partial [Gemmatimonadales bacterium]|nr:glutamine--fructose-6-phosphate aminotransferase [Gemmatimonadales bacterium]